MEFVKIINTEKIRHVEIRLGNQCNFDCSFCHADFKDGTRRPLSLSLYKQTVMNLTNDSGIPTLFTIQGGEPTLYPQLVEFLEFIKSRNGYVQMFSNGSRTVRWWAEFLPRKLVDKLVITHHPEQNASTDQTATIINMAVEFVPEVSCCVTVVKDIFDLAIAHTNTIRSLVYSPKVVKTIPVIHSDETYDIHESYSAEQLDIIKNINQTFLLNGYVGRTFFGSAICQESSGQWHRRTGLAMQLNKENNFKGWECDAGVYRLVIETDEAYNAMCRVGGVVGRVSAADINFSTKPVICDQNDCFCGADITIPKRKLT